jgi:hypothetical protein
MASPLTPEQEANVRKWPIPDHGGAPSCWCEACLRQQLLATIDALRLELQQQSEAWAHVGQLEHNLELAEADARRWRAVRDGLKVIDGPYTGTWRLGDQHWYHSAEFARPASADAAADRMADEQERTDAGPV